MIKYSYKNNELEVSGHALYAKHGTDIVCASVSTMIILSSNLIKRFNHHEFVSINIKEGYFKLTVNKETKEIKTILENLLYSLEELTLEYPNHIKKEWKYVY